MRLFFLILISAVAAFAQFQSGRVAANYGGSVIVIESAAALRGGTTGPDHILSFDGGAGSTDAVVRSPPVYGGLEFVGVAFPFVNVHGSLRAFTLTRPPYCSPIGGCGAPGYEGIVRNTRDGWEIRYPGRAVISREGRWAAFSSPGLQRTTWVDLWTGQETTVKDALDVTAMADDGTLVTPRAQTLLVSAPEREPRLIDLPFYVSSVLVDRSGAVAAVTSQNSIYRLDLASGNLEVWAPTWDSTKLLGIGAGGDRLLFTQWSVLYVLERGGVPRRLSGEGQYVHGAALTGDEIAAVATTLSGIVRYPLDGASGELVIPGDTNFVVKPSALAPGLWLRMAGHGTAQAAITLNRQPIGALSRTPSDLIWAVPAETPTGSAELQIAQPGSPFEPFFLTLPVQLAAPRFLIQRDLGEGSPYYADSPYLRHADTGEPINFQNPARPGESIDVLMTGLNNQGPSVEWLVNRVNVDEYVRPVFESERPHEENPYWRWVRLRLPDLLPGPNCWLSAVYGKSASSAFFFTSTGRDN